MRGSYWGSTEPDPSLHLLMPLHCYQAVEHPVHLELGYKPLQIYSPREVTHYGEED